jgi:hypothetical protein
MGISRLGMAYVALFAMEKLSKSEVYVDVLAIEP